MTPRLIPAFAAALLLVTGLPAPTAARTPRAAPAPASRPLTPEDIDSARALVEDCAMMGVFDPSTTGLVPPQLTHQCNGGLALVDSAVARGKGPVLSPAAAAGLARWQRLRAAARRVAALPWHTGPVSVVAFPQLGPIDLPAGWQLLAPEDTARARRDHDLADDDPGDDHAPTALLFDTRTGEAVELEMLAVGHVRAEPLAPDRLLAVLQERADRAGPFGALSPADRPASAAALRWVEAPASTASATRATWIRPLPGWPAAAEAAEARWVLLGAHGVLVAKLRDFGTERIRHAAAAFAPVWNGMAFRPGERYEDAPTSAASSTTMDDLVAGLRPPDPRPTATVTRRHPPHAASSTHGGWWWLLLLLVFAIPGKSASTSPRRRPMRERERERELERKLEREEFVLRDDNAHRVPRGREQLTITARPARNRRRG